MTGEEKKEQRRPASWKLAGGRLLLLIGLSISRNAGLGRRSADVLAAWRGASGSNRIRLVCRIAAVIGFMRT